MFQWMFPGGLRILTKAILLIKWPIVVMKFPIQYQSSSRAGLPGSWSDRSQDRSWNPIWSRNRGLVRNYWSDHGISSDRIFSGIGPKWLAMPCHSCNVTGMPLAYVIWHFVYAILYHKSNWYSKLQTWRYQSRQSLYQTLKCAFYIKHEFFDIWVSTKWNKPTWFRQYVKLCHWIPLTLTSRLSKHG